MRFRFTLFTEQVIIPADPQPVFPGLGVFVNSSPGTTPWSTGLTPSVSPNTTSQALKATITGGVEDVEYTVDFDIDVADFGFGSTITYKIRLYNSSFTVYEEASFWYPTAGNKVGSATLTPSFVPAYIAFIAVRTGPSGSVTLNSYSASADIAEEIIPAESLEITEPEGWKDTTLKLERHETFHSLIEHFEGDFIFYGQNEFVNGGINYLKEKIDLGIDVTVSIVIDLALDDVNYENVFTGQLAIPEAVEMPNNKLKCNIIRDDFWTKFIKRLDTPVNLQSPYSLDGDSVTVYDSVNLNMTPQKLDMFYYAIEDYGTLIIMNEEYIQYQPSKIILDELKETYQLGRATNPEKPVWIFEPEYDGETLFNLRIEYSKTTTGDGTGHTGARTIYDFWFQKNNETPIEFTYTSGAYVDASVYANWPNPGTIPPGDDSIETTIATFYQSIEMVKGDIIRVYLQRDTPTDNNITFWGDEGLFANQAGAYPLKSPRPSGMQENPTYFRIEQKTVYSATNAEGFLIHDVAALICNRLIGQDEALYSDYFGSLDTLARIYDEFGCSWAYMLLKGLQVRQYSLLEKPFFMSFKQWWEGADNIFSLGLGYEEIDFPPADEPTVDIFTDGFNSGTGVAWAATGFPGFEVSLSAFQSAQRLTFEIFGGVADATYTIGYDVTTSAITTVTLRLYDESFTNFVSTTIFGSGNQTGSKVLVPTFEPKYLTYSATGPIGGVDVEVDEFTFDVTDIPDAVPFTCIRIEKKEHFYDNSYTSAYFPNIREIQWSFDNDNHFNLVRIGYNKWESESASGLDDPQTKSQFNTRFKRAGKTIDLYSSFIAGGLTIETTRRKTKEKSADYKYDNDTFIVAINPDPVEISPETSPDVTDYIPELDENFTTVENINNPDTRYNLRLTPARNLYRWIKFLSGCLQKYLTSTFSFASGEGNFDAVTNMTPFSPDCDEYFGELAENANINVSTEYIFIPKLIEMTVPMTWEDYIQIRQYRKNPIGISQTDSDFTNLFIKELSFKPILGRATISGWPSEDFQLIVPEDEFSGSACVITPPALEECTMLTEDDDTMLTEDSQLMVLEEC